MNIMLKLCFGLSLLSSGLLASIQMKEHERWWTMNVKAHEAEFHSWLGNDNALSRVCSRAYIKDKGYKTILDVPCGLCTEYFGYRKAGMEIDYLGIDITEKLINRARMLQVPVIQGSIEELPCADSSFELCYSRHILEHLPSYENALTELMRVAQREVMVVFFLIPHAGETVIDRAIDGECLLYHNRYSKSSIEEFIQQNPKVRNFNWNYISNAECILHIYLE